MRASARTVPGNRATARQCAGRPTIAPTELNGSTRSDPRQGNTVSSNGSPSLRTAVSSNASLPLVLCIKSGPVLSPSGNSGRWRRVILTARPHRPVRDCASVFIAGHPNGAGRQSPGSWRRSLTPRVLRPGGCPVSERSCRGVCIGRGARAGSSGRGKPNRPPWQEWTLACSRGPIGRRRAFDQATSRRSDEVPTRAGAVRNGARRGRYPATCPAPADRPRPGWPTGCSSAPF